MSLGPGTGFNCVLKPLTMKLASSSGVKVYNLSEGKSLPDWISEKKKRALRKDSGKLSLLWESFSIELPALEFQRRIELIQDFEFRAASQKIKMSDDGQYILATGWFRSVYVCNSNSPSQVLTRL